MNDALIIQIANGTRFREMVSLYYDDLVAYCKLFQFDYWLHSGPVRYWDKDPLIPWAKLALVQQAALQGYQYIVYLDTDVFISDPHVNLRDACIKPVNMVRWWNKKPVTHLQGGVIYFNNTDNLVYQVTSYCLQESKYYLERMPGLRGWYEQGQLTEMAGQPTTEKFIGEIDVRFNWAEDFCPPCANPVITSYHGIKPIEAVISRMKRDMKKRKRIASDALWQLLKIVISVSNPEVMSKELESAVKYLIEEDIFSLEDDGTFTINDVVYKEIKLQVPGKLPFTLREIKEK